MGVAQRYGDAAPIRLVWHYLLSDQLRTSTRTPDALDTLRRDTIELIDRIRAARTFEPRPSALCRWCEFFDLCPAGRERVGGPGLEPPHPAEELPAAVAVAAPLSQPGPALSAAVAAPAAAPTLPRANASGQLRLL
jgi:hypothetical protein